MKQFKAEWEYNRTETTESVSIPATLDNIIAQHNALCDYLEEQEGEKHLPNYELNDPRGWQSNKIITLPKPEWWGIMPHTQNVYLEALSVASKASGILFKLED